MEARERYHAQSNTNGTRWQEREPQNSSEFLDACPARSFAPGVKSFRVDVAAALKFVNSRICEGSCQRANRADSLTR